MFVGYHTLLGYEYPYLWTRPNQHFYGFCEPIQVPLVKSSKQNDTTVSKIRDQVAGSVETMLMELLNAWAQVKPRKVRGFLENHREQV